MKRMLLSAGFGALLTLGGCGSDDPFDGFGPGAGMSGMASSAGGGAASSGGGASATGGDSQAGTAGAGASAGSAGASGTAGNAAAGGAPLTCVGDASECIDATTRRACIDGVYDTADCKTFCNAVGLTEGPCDATPPAGCSCGELLDGECALGVAALCICSKSTMPCSDDQYASLYIGCFIDDPSYEDVLCYEGFVADDDTIDCSAAAAVCL